MIESDKIKKFDLANQCVNLLNSNITNNPNDIQLLRAKLGLMRYTLSAMTDADINTHFSRNYEAENGNHCLTIMMYYQQMEDLENKIESITKSE